MSLVNLPIPGLTRKYETKLKYELINTIMFVIRDNTNTLTLSIKYLVDSLHIIIVCIQE